MEQGSPRADGPSTPQSVRKISTGLSHVKSLGKRIQFKIDHAAFTVKTKQGEKNILNDVSLKVAGGELVAVMGPSGAGKSTLLELASMSLKGGKITGSVTLNKQPLTMKLFQQYAALVEQYDKHWAFLTSQENMEYTASMCVPSNELVRRQRVKDIMDHMGLNECANTRVGNEFIKGISGGQKKRLSIGLALLKGPALLFLDEPTSGLDAGSTAAVMKYLVEMAEEAKMIIIATIHQPSVDVFMSFSRSVFMANGRTAYNGPPSKLKDHCDVVHHPLPLMTNPADHFMKLINSEFSGREKVDAVVVAWDTKEPEDETEDPLETPPQSSFVTKMRTLLKRMALLSIRDPTLYIGRCLVYLFANCFFGLVYVDSRETELANATPRFFYTNWLVVVPSMFNIVVVFAINQEFHLIRKESKNGMVNPSVYFMANFFLQIPYMFLLALFAVGIPAYAIMGYPVSNMGHAVCVLTAMIWSFESIGQFLGVAFENPLIGMLVALGTWFSSFLFGGVFLKPEHIIWPLRAFTYVLPLRWALRSSHYLAFHGSSWENGYTGEQMLDTLKPQFAVESDDTVLEDIIYILIIGIFFKACFFAAIMKKTR